MQRSVDTLGSCSWLRHSRRLTIRRRNSAVALLLCGASAVPLPCDHSRINGEVRPRAARSRRREMDERVFERMLREGKITAEKVLRQTAADNVDGMTEM